MERNQRFFLGFVVLVLSTCPGLSGDDLFKRARQDMDLMNYTKAIQSFEQGLRDDPEKKGIRPQLAFAYFRRERAEDAVKVLREEMALHPDSLDAYILLSYFQFGQGLVPEAVQTCSAFETAFKVVVERMLGGSARRKLKSLSDPQERRSFYQKLPGDFFRKVSEDYPNVGLPSFIRGLDSKRQGRLEEAGRFFEEALQRKYDPTDCAVQIIDLSLVKEDWPGALRTIDEAVRAHGRQAEFDLLKGFAFFQMGRMEEAAQSYQSALERKPYLLEAQRNLAKVYFRQRDFGMSASLLRSVVRLSTSFDFGSQFLLEHALKGTVPAGSEHEPRLSKEAADGVKLRYRHAFSAKIDTVLATVNAAALSIIQSGGLGAAKKYLQDFLSFYDAAPELHYNLAQVSNATSDPEEALEHAWMAIRLKPDYRDAYDLLGNVYFKAGVLEGSLAAYGEALRIDPEDAMAHYNVACVDMALNDFPRAEESFRRAIQYESQDEPEKKVDKASQDPLSVSVVVRARPISFESHKALGRIYLRQGQRDKALAEFESAIGLEPADQECYFEAGKILLEQKNTARAVAYLEKYIYLGGKKADEAQEMLKGIKPKPVKPQEEKNA
jgi:tetratricopeptide (TPR) repeat protein